MSVAKKFLLGVGAAALMATGVAGTANAHVVLGATNPCDMYARQYAAVNAPHFGLGGWDAAYSYAYNECLAGGPTFVSAPPGPLALAGAALAAPLTVAGAALSATADVVEGTAAALAPPVLDAPPVVVSPTAEPVVVRNYRGTFEVDPLDVALPATAAVAPPPPLEPEVAVEAEAALAPPPPLEELEFEPTPEAAAVAEPVVTRNFRGQFEVEPVVAVEIPPATAALALEVRPEQFTPEWYAYCAAKYRSFDPETGMYLAYSGQYRMCS